MVLFMIDEESRSVPAATVVAPVQVFVPDKVWVPAPIFVMATEPAPSTIAPPNGGRLIVITEDKRSRRYRGIGHANVGQSSGRGEAVDGLGLAVQVKR